MKSVINSLKSKYMAAMVFLSVVTKFQTTNLSVAKIVNIPLGAKDQLWLLFKLKYPNCLVLDHPSIGFVVVHENNRLDFSNDLEKYTYRPSKAYQERAKNETYSRLLRKI